jgi:phosphonopyruvate decarboxylase
LVIGWRGAPLVHDEPQHKKQGKVTLDMLDAMQIPYEVLADNEKEAENQIEKAFAHINKCKSPFAFVVKKDTFAPYTLQKKEIFNAEMTREEAIEKIMLNFKDSFFVSTTGMASRELYELREKYKNNHNFDFLTVGSMGHASSIALAIAIQKPNIKVVILDGDGAVLMHLGALASIGVIKPNNLIHFVLNNRAHDSVGGQPTIAGKIDLCAFAKDAGYTNVYKADTKEKLCNVLSGAPKINGLSFIEVSVKKGARKDLGRPASSPCENKIAFMNCIKEAK